MRHPRWTSFRPPRRSSVTSRARSGGIPLCECPSCYFPSFSFPTLGRACFASSAFPVFSRLDVTESETGDESRLALAAIVPGARARKKTRHTFIVASKHAGIACACVKI